MIKANRNEGGGISEAAWDLVRESEVIDLHVDTFILVRALGYELGRRHGTGPFGGRFGYHLDVPRMIDGGLTGALWSVTTNPLRTARGRFETWKRNARRLRREVDALGGRVRLVSTRAEYAAARAAGAHAALLCIQGGHALSAAPEGDLGDPGLVQVTLVHLTPSSVGDTSSPLGGLGDRGLTRLGEALVRRLDAHRVFVDLAHVSRRGFWQAVAVHDRSLPLLVTHTGASGVRPHWRNLDDAQLRAVADSGGVVGIMFAPGFLARPGGPKDAHMVAEHLEHVVKVAGEDAAALGSDFDGMISPPPDLRSGDTAYARLVEVLLERRWPEARIVKVLGLNFLRALEELRP